MIIDIKGEDRLVQQAFVIHPCDRLGPNSAYAYNGGTFGCRTFLAPIRDWTEKASTHAEVKVFVLDKRYEALPRPPFTEPETDDTA